MAKLIAMAVLAAGALTIGPKQEPGSVRMIALSPVALSDAAAEFSRICVASDFQAKAFTQFVSASSWKFEEEAGVGEPRPLIRRASQALLMFSGLPTQEQKSFAPGQCNMDFALAAPVGKDVVLEVLRGISQSRAGDEAELHHLSGESCYRSTSAGQVRRLCLMGAREAVQHVRLSYQLWTSTGEVRAGLKPR